MEEDINIGEQIVSGVLNEIFTPIQDIDTSDNPSGNGISERGTTIDPLTGEVITEKINDFQDNPLTGNQLDPITGRELTEEEKYNEFLVVAIF